MNKAEKRKLEAKYGDIPIEQRAVIYARYSTKNQTPESIERQKELCHDYAEKNGLTVIKEYQDKAKSGTKTLTRDGYNQMLEDSAERLFSKVLVFKFDRFSRNLRDFLNDEHRLNSNGVQILSTLEFIPDGKAGELFKVMLIQLAASYVDAVSDHTSSALYRKAKQGKYNGGKIPFGYTTAEDGDDKKFVIDEKEAEVIKFIFKQYEQGKSYEELAQILDQRGIRNKQGGRFTKGSFNSILNNRIYVGEIVYGKKTDRAVVTKAPELQIISDELFTNVQKRTEQNRSTAGQKSGRRHYILSGYVKCGKCGATMQLNSTSRTNKDKTYPYSAYVCPNTKKKDKKGNKLCDCRGVRRKYLERYVIDKIVSRLLGSVSLKDLTDRLNAYIRSQEKELNKELKKKREDLKALKKRRDTLMTKIGDGINGLDCEFYTTESHISEIRKEISDCKTRLKAKELEPDDVIELIIMLYKHKIRMLDIPEFHDFIKAYVKMIIVREDNIGFRFNFPHPTAAE